MTPHSGKQFLPATPSSLSWTLEDIFELTRRPSRALDWPCTLLPELQRIMDTVTYAQGVEGPGHRQDRLSQTLIVTFVEKTLTFVIPNIMVWRGWASLTPLSTV